MPIGLRIYDPVTQEIMVDLTGRFSKVLGSVETGTSNGSAVLSLSEPGEVFVVAVPLSSRGTHGRAPVYVVNGTIVSWEFYTNGNLPGNLYPVSHRLYYGVY